MENMETTRRDLLQSLGALPLVALLSRPGEAAAQASGGSPGKVDTKGLTAKIKFESVLSGYLTDLNGKYKLRVTESSWSPGDMSASTTTGPGIRQVTSGYMTYVLPDKTVVYGPGDFFESGDVTHTAQNKTDAPMVHICSRFFPPTTKARRSCRRSIDREVVSGRKTPRSVMMAPMSAAGVTSKAGL